MVHRCAAVQHRLTTLVALEVGLTLPPACSGARRGWPSCGHAIHVVASYNPCPETALGSVLGAPACMLQAPRNKAVGTGQRKVTRAQLCVAVRKKQYAEQQGSGTHVAPRVPQRDLGRRLESIRREMTSCSPGESQTLSNLLPAKSGACAWQGFDSLSPRAPALFPLNVWASSMTTQGHCRRPMQNLRAV